MMNSKKVILLINLTMCNTESLITEIRKSINIYKNEIKLKEKSVYYFINSHCLLLSLIIYFLFKDNFVTFIIINSLFYQL